MSFVFEQGDTNTIYLTVLRLANTVPGFPTDYTIPELRISHVNGGSEVEDLVFTQMTQVSTSNRWFHKFAIPLTAQLNKYLVTFKTTLDGAESFTAEEYKVAAPVGLSPGGGAFNVTVTVKNQITLAPIANATVRIFAKSTPTVVLASTTTDTSGNATVFLDAGNYLIEFAKTGVIAEVHDMIVNPDGSHNVLGD